jgi:hypothetical protein
MEIPRHYNLFQGGFQHIHLRQVFDPLRVDNTMAGNIIRAGVLVSKNLNNK